MAWFGVTVIYILGLLRISMQRHEAQNIEPEDSSENKV